MTRMIPSWLTAVMDALEREALRDPFVSSSLHAARAFEWSEREFFLTLVRALSTERERLVRLASDRTAATAVFFDRPAVNALVQAAAVERAQAAGEIPTSCPHGYERSTCELCKEWMRPR